MPNFRSVVVIIKSENVILSAQTPSTPPRSPIYTVSVSIVLPMIFLLRGLFEVRHLQGQGRLTIEVK